MAVSIQRQTIASRLRGRDVLVNIDDFDSHVEMTSGDGNHVFKRIPDTDTWILYDGTDFDHALGMVERGWRVRDLTDSEREELGGNKTGLLGNRTKSDETWHDLDDEHKNATRGFQMDAHDSVIGAKSSRNQALSAQTYGPPATPVEHTDMPVNGPEQPAPVLEGDEVELEQRGEEVHSQPAEDDPYKEFGPQPQPDHPPNHIGNE
jgi:hypothetical protein